MTEQDKVTVDDIIGIVKTEEQTNSVEEVRKLRGRGNETAKRFKVTNNTDNPFLCDWSVTDYADGGIVHHPMTSENMANVMCELLNELHEENNELRLQLNLCSDQRNEFHRGARENANRVGKLEKENEQLKTTIQQLTNDNTKQKKKLNTTMKENEQLKQQIADWETSFDICKHYKEAYGTEIVKIKQTIKDMIESERTEIGKMTLQHLWRQIQ